MNCAKHKDNLERNKTQMAKIFWTCDHCEKFWKIQGGREDIQELR